MARYSVAATKDNLSSLIEKALAGEDVVITRHGKPIVRIVPDAPLPPRKDVRAATARLRAQLAALPSMRNPGRSLMDEVKDGYRY